MAGFRHEPPEPRGFPLAPTHRTVLARAKREEED